MLNNRNKNINYNLNIENFYHSNIEKLAKEFYPSDILIKKIFIIKDNKIKFILNEYSNLAITEIISKSNTNITEYIIEIANNLFLFCSVHNNNLILVFPIKYLKNKKITNFLNNLKSLTINETEYLKISNYIEHGGNIKIFNNYIELNQIKKKIKKKYYKYLGLEPYKIAREFFKSEDSILILTGKPGTGKSKFILSLLLNNKNKENYINIYVKGNNALNLTLNDSILYNTSKSVLIILDDFNFQHFEDVEEDLNLLLSLTDGIFDKKIKIIISTNDEKINIEKFPALLRPGRLFKLIELKPFPIEKIENNTIKEKLKKLLNKDEITIAEYTYLLNKINKNDKTNQNFNYNINTKNIKKIGFKNEN